MALESELQFGVDDIEFNAVEIAILPLVSRETKIRKPRPNLRIVLFEETEPREQLGPARMQVRWFRTKKVGQANFQKRMSYSCPR